MIFVLHWKSGTPESHDRPGGRDFRGGVDAAGGGLGLTFEEEKSWRYMKIYWNSPSTSSILGLIIINYPNYPLVSQKFDAPDIWIIIVHILVLDNRICDVFFWPWKILTHRQPNCGHFQVRAPRVPNDRRQGSNGQSGFKHGAIGGCLKMGYTTNDS